MMLRAYKTRFAARCDDKGMRLTVLLVLAAACSSSQSKRKFDDVTTALPPKTTSVLVMQRGEIVYEQYFGGADASTLHDTRSVGKSFTSLAMGVAIEKGLVSGVDAKVFPVLSDLAPFAHDTPLKQEIMVEDFLTMSSALDCNDDDENSPGNEENMYPLQTWAKWAVDVPTQATYTRDASGRGLWHYCTAGTVLLGQMIQRAAKQPIDEFIAAELFAPLGITKWEFTRSPANEVMTGGGLRLRSRDFAAAMEMVRLRGKRGDQQIVPAAYIDRALTVHRRAFPGQDYGYLFWTRTYHTTCGDFVGWFMSGNGGNAVIAIPKLEAVVVVTRSHYGQRGMHQQTTSLVEGQILPHLCGP
jgi:CubicO group peptidase (beta-lactamase class C family)